MAKVEDNRLIKKHMRKAEAAGKCQQCQHPWYDGICSCGKAGPAEVEIAKLAYQLIEENGESESERIY